MVIKNFKSLLWVVTYQDGSKELVNVEEYDDEFLIFEDNTLYSIIKTPILSEAFEEYKVENPHISKIEVFSYKTMVSFEVIK